MGSHNAMQNKPKTWETSVYVEEKQKHIFLTLRIFEREGNCARNKYIPSTS